MKSILGETDVVLVKSITCGNGFESLVCSCLEREEFLNLDLECLVIDRF